MSGTLKLQITARQTHAELRNIIFRETGEVFFTIAVETKPNKSWKEEFHPRVANFNENLISYTQVSKTWNATFA